MDLKGWFLCFASRSVRSVPVAASRTMVEAARKLGVKLVYVEVPGGSHSGVVVPQFGPMFDFFAEQAREAAAGK